MPHKCSIVGLGKLGASMLAALAHRGHSVIGVDINQAAVDLVNAGRAPVQETGLDAMIAANRERIRATTNHEEALHASDITFVIVPTPSDVQGAFSLQYVSWAFRELGRALRTKNRYHLVVLTSTVLPGATTHALLPLLTQESGKQCGVDFGLCYSPEFIALGSVIDDFLNPDFTLIGEFDAASGARLEGFYAETMLNGAPSKRMSIENAELTKIALNTYVTMKVSFANMIADLCERIPGGDVDIVTGALGADRRIGGHYLTGAVAYGGPCFPRDNVALSFFARAVGTRARMAEVTDEVNRALAATAVAELAPLFAGGATVAVLGLAYKPHSPVIEESAGIHIARAAATAGARVVAFDPLAADLARAELKHHAIVMDSLQDCLRQAEIVLITTPDPMFRRLTAGDFRSDTTPVVVVDYWRILAGELAEASNVNYMPGGRNRDAARARARLSALWQPGGAGET